MLFEPIISSSILALPEVALVVEVAVAVVMLRMEMMVHVIMRMSGRLRNSILFLFLALMATYLPQSCMCPSDVLNDSKTPFKPALRCQ